MKLTKKYIITGQIEAVTGIAIGGTNAAMSIGGVDKGVIRNPVTNEPYIPGSSLKGKMRSLLELRDGTIGDEPMGIVKNGPSNNQQHRSSRLFGNAAKRQDDKQRPSRAVVRDAFLSDDQVTEQGTVSKNDYFKTTDLPFTEVKTEVVIDRITSRAMPRQLERVPAGARFDFEVVLNVFDEDNQDELLNDLFAAMQLLQNDYIGGAGSRGSGQIRFLKDTMSVSMRTQKFYLFEEEEKDVTQEFKDRFPK